MKKIAVDCRYLGMSGIGRFLEGILQNLNFLEYDFYLIGKKENVVKYKNCNYIFDYTNPFSIKGNFNCKLKNKINKMDVFFSPNFLIPFGVKIKTIITLHDVLFLDMPSVNKNKIETLEKKLLIKKNLKKSSQVLTISKFSYDRICYYFPNVKKKILFFYQGVEKKFVNFPHCSNKEDYIVYVGNVKKQKGLSTLIEASKMIDLDVVIIGDKDGFKNKDLSLDFDINKNVRFTGKVSDKELLEIVSRAKFLIQPSLYEGFGIPPLEALFLGTRPIISDIDVFLEIYSDLPVVFFKKNNAMDLAEKIKSSDYVFSFDKHKTLEKFNYCNFTNALYNYFENKVK